MAAAGAKPAGDQPHGESRFGFRGIIRRTLPLTFVLCAITVGTTTVTVLLGGVVAELLAAYSNIAGLGELLVFALSAILAMTLYSLIICRPIRQLDEAVQRLAERSDDSSLVDFKSDIREIARLVSSVLTVRSRLIADEQRAVRVASDMIQVAKASGDWLWKEDANHRFIEFLNVNATPESSALVEKRIGMTRMEIANHPD